MDSFLYLADKSLAGMTLSQDEALTILQIDDSRLPELLRAAFVVRERFFRPEGQDLYAAERAERTLSGGLSLLLAVGGLHRAHHQVSAVIPRAIAFWRSQSRCRRCQPLLYGHERARTERERYRPS